MDAFEPGELVVKARIKTVPLKQWLVGRELRKRIARMFGERGIPVPIPEMHVHLDGTLAGAAGTGRASEAGEADAARRADRD